MFLEYIVHLDRYQGTAGYYAVDCGIRSGGGIYHCSRITEYDQVRYGIKSFKLASGYHNEVIIAIF